MSALTWVIVALLAVDLIFDVFLLVENRKCVREAEAETDTAREYRDEMKKMFDLIMEVITGAEEVDHEEGGTEPGPATSGAHPDPRLAAVTDELPRIVGS